MNHNTLLQNAKSNAQHKTVLARAAMKAPPTLAQRRANARLNAQHLPTDLAGAFHRFQRPSFVAESTVSVEEGFDSWL